jgi:fructose-bisphosphate aldolase class II
MQPIFNAARTGGVDQGAFNVNTIAQVSVVIEAHEAFGSACIMQIVVLANGFIGGRLNFQNASVHDKQSGTLRIADSVCDAANARCKPIALYLYHGGGLDAIRYAEKSGLTSTMIVGSALTYQDNLDLACEAVRIAHYVGVSDEIERGVPAAIQGRCYRGEIVLHKPQ